MSTAKIASIYWNPVQEDLSAFGFGIYSMPAVAHGADPAIITVTDRIQRDQGPYNGQRRRQPLSYQHPGESIAASLLNSWTRLGTGMTPDCHPGIWIVREKMPQMVPERQLESGQIVPTHQECDGEGKGIWRDATPEERAAMWDEDLTHARHAQALYAEYLFQQAAVLADDAKTRKFIPAVTRKAAAYYRRDFDWMKEGVASEDQISCQWCLQRIPAASIICHKCSQIVNLERFAALKAKQESAVEEALTRPELPKGAAPTRKAAMGLSPGA